MAVPMWFGGRLTFDACKVVEKYEKRITEAESARDEAENLLAESRSLDLDDDTHSSSALRRVSVPTWGYVPAL
jgi:hypothetical protein